MYRPLTARKIIAKVRALAERSPQNRYLDDSPCSYTSGICADKSVGCIFGQALIALGVPTDDLDTSRGITGLLADMHVPCTPKESCWMATVQSMQDMKQEWTIAISKADRPFKL